MSRPSRQGVEAGLISLLIACLMRTAEDGAEVKPNQRIGTEGTTAQIPGCNPICLARFPFFRDKSHRKSYGATEVKLWHSANRENGKWARRVLSVHTTVCKKPQRCPR